jgi:hypothetical protein
MMLAINNNMVHLFRRFVFHRSLNHPLLTNARTKAKRDQPGRFFQCDPARASEGGRS